MIKRVSILIERSNRTINLLNSINKWNKNLSVRSIGSIRIKTNKQHKDNINHIHTETCSHGHELFSFHKRLLGDQTYLHGNMVCRSCNHGCHQFVHLQDRQIKMSKCCNPLCITNLTTN